MNAQWDSIRYLETEPTARKFLSERYQSQGYEQPERLAFHHSTRFIYTWKQARAYYQAATSCDLLIKPLLLFYGCSQLLKGYLISVDPFYPQNSRVLQHGVTSRKIKRSPYHLLDDEVRPQKEGFFAYLAKRLKLTPVQERYTVKELFCCLADLANDYSTVVAESAWHKVAVSSQGEISFPFCGHGTLAYSPETFLHYLNRLCPNTHDFNFILSPNKQDKSVCIYSKADHTFRESLLESHPLFSRTCDGQFFFWNDSPEYLPLPIWAAHYLLLYTLSMLSRYESEHWGELVLTTSFAETILVQRFLFLHETLFPAVILDLMH